MLISAEARHTLISFVVSLPPVFGGRRVHYNLLKYGPFILVFSELMNGLKGVFVPALGVVSTLYDVKHMHLNVMLDLLLSEATESC